MFSESLLCLKRFLLHVSFLEQVQMSMRHRYRMDRTFTYAGDYVGMDCGDLANHD